MKQEIITHPLTHATIQSHLKQAYIRDTKTGRTYNNFVFANDKSSHDISILNPKKEESFKMTIGAKGITTFDLAGTNQCRSMRAFGIFIHGCR